MLTTESLHAHGVGVWSATGESCIDCPLLAQGSTDNLLALVACCVFRRRRKGGGGLEGSHAQFWGAAAGENARQHLCTISSVSSCFSSLVSLLIQGLMSDPLILLAFDNLLRLPRTPPQVSDQLRDIILPLTGTCEE